MTKLAKYSQWLPIIGVFVVLKYNEEEDALCNSNYPSRFYGSILYHGITSCAVIITTTTLLLPR